MKEQIREIIAQHVGGTYEDKQKCAEEILRLSGVVGENGTGMLCFCECEMPNIDGRKGLCGKCERPIIA